MVCEASETREKPKETRSEQRKDYPRKKNDFTNICPNSLLKQTTQKRSNEGRSTTSVAQQQQQQQEQQQRQQQQQPQRGSDDGRRRRLGGDEGHILWQNGRLTVAEGPQEDDSSTRNGLGKHP
ncbi:unnamed protein product [Sphagnum balticum]